MPNRDPALAAFIRDEHPRLVGAVGLYCGDRDLAEECAAEALARVARDWHEVRAMARPGAYAHRIAINLANSWFRRRAARRRALARRGPEPTVHHDQDTAAVLSVREAVAALPDRQRACVVLHYFTAMPTPDVATALGVDPGTVRSNLHAARATLRAALGGDVAIPEPSSPAPVGTIEGGRP